jgi:hypothetical protein
LDRNVISISVYMSLRLCKTVSKLPHCFPILFFQNQPKQEGPQFSYRRKKFSPAKKAVRWLGTWFGQYLNFKEHIQISPIYASGECLNSETDFNSDNQSTPTPILRFILRKSLKLLKERTEEVWKQKGKVPTGKLLKDLQIVPELYDSSELRKEDL